MAVHCVLRKYIHIISSSLIKERSLTFISLSSSYLLSRLLMLWHNSIERKLKITPESPIIEKKNKYFLAFSSPVKIYLKFQFIFFPMQHKTLTKENLNVKHCNDKKNKLISIWGILQKYLISIKIIRWVLINSLSLFPLGICYTSYFYKCVWACTVGLFNIYRAESGNWWIAKSFVKGDDFLFSFKISVAGCYDGKCLSLFLLNGTDWHKVFLLRLSIFKM